MDQCYFCTSHTTHLEKTFAFEFQVLLFSRPQQQSYALVADISVDIKDIAERDGDHVRLIAARCALLANNFTKLQNFLQYMGVRFATAKIRQRARFRSEMS